MAILYEQSNTKNGQLTSQYEAADGRNETG